MLLLPSGGVTFIAQDLFLSRYIAVLNSPIKGKIQFILTLQGH
ncbi:MAG: hypothetical protein Q8P67_19135 [archaeon]|nr:hypothetical protein [archaeon]